VNALNLKVLIHVNGADDVIRCGGNENINLKHIFGFIESTIARRKKTF